MMVAGGIGDQHACRLDLPACLSSRACLACSASSAPSSAFPSSRLYLFLQPVPLTRTLPYPGPLQHATALDAHRSGSLRHVVRFGNACAIAMPLRTTPMRASNNPHYDPMKNKYAGRR